MKSREFESIVVEDALVRLRPPTDSDAAAAFEMLRGNRAILDWIRFPEPVTREEVARSLSMWRARGEHGDNFAFAIEELATSAVCGVITLHLAQEPERARIGYWIDTRKWGRGLGGEAVRCACWLAFEHLASREVCARAWVGNDASRRVLEKNGFAIVADDAVPALAEASARPQWAFRLQRAAFRARVGAWRPARCDIR